MSKRYSAIITVGGFAIKNATVKKETEEMLTVESHGELMEIRKAHIVVTVVELPKIQT